jgi:NADPH-dependent ferric siderophore reductase
VDEMSDVSGESATRSEAAIRTRRQPPPFRRLAVQGIEQLSPRLRRVVLGGPELEGLEIDSPAASVRLLLPPRGSETLAMPTWTGNQFELADGRRAPIRTFTPRRLDRQRLELSLDIVIHDRGAASDWARAAKVGDEVAVSGPARGYEVNPNDASYLLAGDETAIPAMSQLLESIPSTAAVQVHVEIADESGRLELPAHPNATVEWRLSGAEPGAAFAEAVESVSALPDVVWVAGEAAAVQRVRKHLFETRGMDRSAVTARGYWKHGRAATE